MNRTSIKTKSLKAKKPKKALNKSIPKALAINFITNNANNERNNWMSKLFELRSNSVFVDATVITSDYKKFHIDRNVFAASSHYFKALFSNALCSETLTREVFLPDISSDIMEIIVNFVYTGQLLNINEANVERFLQAVNRLQVNGALEYCHQYLIDCCNIENCVKIYQMSRMYYAPTVIAMAKLFILYNFSTIYKESDDYIKLTRDEISDLLMDDRLNVSREEMTYSSVVSWVSASVQRIEYFPRLLKFVRFGNSSLKFVETTVKDNILVSSNEELKAYVDRVISVLNDIHLHPLPSKFDIHMHPFLRPRIPRDIIFVFGGWSSASATRELETYDSRVNKWFTADPSSLSLTPYRAYHGMVHYNGLIYVIGGFDGRQHFNTVKAFDPRTKEWSNKACMQTARCYVSVALCDDYIYALGGFDGAVRTSSAERYSFADNQWEYIANMNNQRSDASATSLNGKIYIVGGFNGNEVLNTAEVYDPIFNEWSAISNMNRPRSGVQLVQHDSYIYAIGGNDGIIRQTSIERYDPQSETWTLLSNMKTPRSNFAATVLEDLIYVIGGFNGVTTISEVESYDPKSNCWQEMWKMNLHRSASSACVVSQLENAQHYTWLKRLLNDNSK